jgi:glycosyltransferase involved in cell wall biosynthesis
VRLLGDRDDARELIADADVFVLPSFNEGLPLVVLEALHAGRPLVASDLPGLRGVVVDGESGILVPAGSAQALAGAIGTLIDNPEAARMLGRAGRAHAREEFSIERTAASYLELYSQVLDRRRG